MKKLLLLCILALSHISYSQEFQRVYGDSLSDVPRDIITTSTNDLLVVGQTEDDTYTLNGLLTKIDTAGNVIWSKTYGDPGRDDYLASVIEDNGFYYAVGMTRSFSVDTSADVFVIKTDLNGDVIWMRTYGGTGENGGYTGDYANAIVKESTNSFLVAGAWASQEAGSFQGGYLIRINDAGTLQDEFIVDGVGSEWFSYLTVAQNGDILISGTNKLASAWEPWFYRMSSTGVSLVNRGYGTGIANDYGNSILEVGNDIYFLSDKGAETMISRLNSAGDTLDVIILGDSLAVAEPKDLFEAQDGNLFLLGEFNQKGLIAKLDLNGDTLWVNYLQNNLGDYRKMVELNGYLYISGRTVSNTNGSDDIYLVKIKNDGSSDLCISEDYPSFYYYHGDCVITTWAEPTVTAGSSSAVVADTSSALYNKCEICIIPDFSYVVNDQTVQFTNLTNVNVNYNWDFGDGNTSSNVSPTYTYSSYGSFTVCLTSSDACSGDSICQTIEIKDYTGIEELMLGTKELVKVVDLMGRETTPQKNKTLIYVYSDGTTERVFEFE